MRKQTARVFLTPAQRDGLVAFLRDWLPDDAKRVYRDMIRANPDGWWHDPHFAGGIIVDYALRGNGFDERALGVVDLEPLWHELLERAVADFERVEDPQPAAPPADGDDKA